MLEVQHSEEALGGSDNTALSHGPLEAISLVTVPSSAPDVFLIRRTFPHAYTGSGQAESELVQWQDFEKVSQTDV